jgi:hypothetical protein
MVLDVPNLGSEPPAQAKQTKDHLVTPGHLSHGNDHDWQQKQTEHVEVESEQQAAARTNGKGDVWHPRNIAGRVQPRNSKSLCICLQQAEHGTDGCGDVFRDYHLGELCSRSDQKATDQNRATSEILLCANAI